MPSLKRNNEDSSCSGAKRKHIALSVMQKVEIVQKMESGATPRFIADTYGIAVRTVYDIRKNKEKILKFYSQSYSNVGMQKRKSLHAAKSSELDAVLFEWFKQRRSDGVPISGPILKEKARQIHAELKISEPCDFSSGWLSRFKQRHGIRYLKACGEKLSSDTEAAERFIEDFFALVTEENLSPEQIFNMDETGLFWRCLPRKTFVTSDESAPSGVKEAKERLTILLCSNSAGTYKCKPLVVGKSARPRPLKDVKVLPVLYKSNKKAWITRELMKNWFFNHFIKEARRHCNSVGLAPDCKIVLLLDNCTAHPDDTVLHDDNVLIKFLPPNTTAIIQPMDQGIIQSVKCHYKSEFLKKILDTDSTSFELSDIKKHFTIKDCLYLVKDAWDLVSKATLVNAWHNLWPSSLFIETEDDDYEWSGFRRNSAKDKARELLLYAKKNCEGEPLYEEENIVDWILNEDESAECQMTDEEIIQSVLGPTNEEDSDSDSDADTNRILFDEGLELGEKYLKFLEQQKCITDQEVMLLYNIKKKLRLEHPKVLKQTTLTKMFVKK